MHQRANEMIGHRNSTNLRGNDARRNSGTHVSCQRQHYKLRLKIVEVRGAKTMKFNT